MMVKTTEDIMESMPFDMGNYEYKQFIKIEWVELQIIKSKIINLLVDLGNHRRSNTRKIIFVENRLMDLLEDLERKEDE